MIQVHGMSFSGAGRDVEEEQAAAIQQRREKPKLAREVGKMFQNVEREYGSKALPRRFKSFLGVKESDVQTLI